MSHVAPFTINSFTPGKSVTPNIGTPGFPIQGVKTTIGGKQGYYYRGIPEESALGTSQDYEWKTGWTTMGTEGGGILFKSRQKGISIFFAAAGDYLGGTLRYYGSYGDYQTCRTNGNTQTSLSIFMAGYDIGTGDGYRNYGRKVRPAMDIQGL